MWMLKGREPSALQDDKLFANSVGGAAPLVVSTGRAKALVGPLRLQLSATLVVALRSAKRW